MRTFITFLTVCILIPALLSAQSTFDKDDYVSFLKNNQDLSAGEALQMFPPPNDYYSEVTGRIPVEKFVYLDTIKQKLELTDDETELLRKNRFVVTERLSYNTFGQAFHDVYIKDLPVFVTTDAILHALHFSYDKILLDLERAIMEPNLKEFIAELRSNYPALKAKYADEPKMQQALKDVDLYISIANGLLNETEPNPQNESKEVVNAVWNAIKDEEMVEMPLFSEKKRKLDFSQFTVRGHYTQEFYDGQRLRTLGNYFKAMMWLGRIDFMLSPPPDNPWEDPWTKEDMRRMYIGAVLMHELVKGAATYHLLEQNDKILTFLIGESDNMTPTELSGLIQKQSIKKASDLLSDAVYDSFYDAVNSEPEFGQRILSQFLIMDPFSTEPGTVPASFRLMGQRFIIDSYVFSNVVFDRIIYKEEKIWRPMPDPLDAMFVLGNDNALPLLRNELENYKYSKQLASLRYLVDAYDAEFWNKSLYNVWLQSLRELNTPEDMTNYPLFMHTVAWQQEKLNTQLSSWAQLRHDNLLYAKQSYTGGTGCLFPHSYVEPYPEFYKQIAIFAEKAGAYFNQLESDAYQMYRIKDFFPRLKDYMLKLEALARKELNHELFTEDDVEFLQSMLFLGGGSGQPPFTGWYSELFYDPNDAAKGDFIVADVHTQPTDQFGNVVGNVLHVGVGMVNLGVFLAPSPSNAYKQTAFVGPVMSYYEKTTSNFDRLTDERWTNMVVDNDLPARPDWVNIYLADAQGQSLEQGRQLRGTIVTSNPKQLDDPVELFNVFPNPTSGIATIHFKLAKQTDIRISVYDMNGRVVKILLDETHTIGEHAVKWDTRDVKTGMYIIRFESNRKSQSMILNIER